MAREWNGQHCQRCYEKSSCYIMSMFNEQMICQKCKTKEEARDDYKDAREADEAAIRQGNYNFKGVGLNGK